MPITYTYEAPRRVVRAVAGGKLCTGDFRDYTSRILGDEKIAPGFIEALVIEADVDMDIRFVELPPFREVWKRYLAKGVQGTLIQTNTDSGFGMFRMFQSTIASEDLDPDRAFELVRTPEEMERRIAEIRERFPVGG